MSKWYELDEVNDTGASWVIGMYILLRDARDAARKYRTSFPKANLQVVRVTRQVIR